MISYSCQKRIFDIFFSAVLIVCTLPIMLFIATIVFIDLRSVFFVQERIGQYGKPFNIWKFRTMRKASRAEEHEVDYSNNRTTKVGAFLRKTKLDELPQLFQVLWGVMSIVGPRPELASYINKQDSKRVELLNYKPGLIDLASLDFIKEENLFIGISNKDRYYKSVIMPIKINKSLQTVHNNNLFLELKIIVKGALGLFRKRIIKASDKNETDDGLN